MALVPTVTKKAVGESFSKCFTITANLTCTDAAVEVINQDFSVKHELGDPISESEAELQAAMQKAIDKYKREQGIYTAAALDTAIANIENNLVG